MRINFFRTPKPKRYSFHTRYFDENKINTDDSAKVEKGGFAKFKNKYRSNPFEKEFAVKERNRKFTILSIMLGFLVLYLIVRGFFMYSLLPGAGFLVLVFLLLKAPTK